jgi:stress-induced morphogen
MCHTTAHAHCRGLSIVKQHQAVHKVLREDIARWHGLNLETRAVQ